MILNFAIHECICVPSTRRTIERRYEWNTIRYRYIHHDTYMGCLNIHMSSYQNRDLRVKDKTVVIFNTGIPTWKYGIYIDTEPRILYIYMPFIGAWVLCKSDSKTLGIGSPQMQNYIYSYESLQSSKVYVCYFYNTCTCSIILSDYHMWLKLLLDAWFIWQSQSLYRIIALSKAISASHMRWQGRSSNALNVLFYKTRTQQTNVRNPYCVQSPLI